MAKWLAPVALLLVLVGGLAWLMSRSARRGTFEEAVSTYRSAPDGSRALYLLAEGAGLKVARRHHDLQVFEKRGTLVLLDVGGAASCSKDEGSASPFAGIAGGLSGTECSTIVDWVKGGGSLVDVVRGKGALLDAFGIDFRAVGTRMPGTVDAPVDQGPIGAGEADGGTGDQQPDGGVADGGTNGDADGGAADGGVPVDLASLFATMQRKPLPLGPKTTLVPGQPTRLDLGVSRVSTPIAGYVWRPDGNEVRVLVDQKGERPSNDPAPSVAVAVPYGQGWVLAIAAPDLATNAFLAHADNAVFWVSALRDLTGKGEVIFDEYHHGHAAGRTLIGYAISEGLGPAIVQILLVLVVGVFAGRRLGKAVPLPVETLRSSADYLASMARLYREGRHGEHAGAAIVARAERVSRGGGGSGEVASALEVLRGARRRLETEGEQRRDTRRALTEVARRAAAVYHALSVRKRRGRTRSSAGSGREPKS